MKKVLALVILVLSFSLSSFASKDLVTAVKPYAKHPAILTRSYHGAKFVGKKAEHVGKVVVVKTYHVTKKVLF